MIALKIHCKNAAKFTIYLFSLELGNKLRLLDQTISNKKWGSIFFLTVSSLLLEDGKAVDPNYFRQDFGSLVV